MSGEGNVLWRVDQWFPQLKESTLQKLHRYQEELIRYNTKLNLIGRQTERDSDEQHFADCISAGLLVLEHLEPDCSSICDLGSGNGLPGLVLGILSEELRPTLKVRLVDSDERKCEFLKQMGFSLPLPQVEVVNGRVEDLKDVPAAITRGYASVSKVCLVCKDVFNVGGTIFHMKGSNWVREVGEMPSQLCAF